MTSLPKFLLYGQDDISVEEILQPILAVRKWSSLSDTEKQVAFQELENRGWLEDYSSEILQTIEYLNHSFLRLCPGRHLHNIKPQNNLHGSSYSNEHDRKKAALMDFQHILLQERSDAMVFRMLSKFCSSYIDGYSYRRAVESDNGEQRKELVDQAFERFDKLGNCFNHIFEQFAINQIVTRNGFVPRQDKKIIDNIYTPTLRALADPRWKTVSDDLTKMFDDYREENYSETITKAHSSVQRFLQIIVGNEGKSGKGEFAKLFQEAKNKGLIPANRFTEPLINVMQGFIVSERATNSTAKPTLIDATAPDALLMMNVVLVFLQYCLQSIK